MKNSFDYYKRIESPDMYLCNPDQRFLCALHGVNRTLTLRFNDLSELSFTVPKIEGTEESYNLIKSKRLVYVDNIGWFQIKTAEEVVEGDKCQKNVTAKSHQTVLFDRGFVTENRVYMFYNPNDRYDDIYDSSNLSAIPSVVGQLSKQLGIKVALTMSEMEPTEDYKEWTLTYIDPSLRFRSRSSSDIYTSAEDADNICRSFEEKTDTNGYEFIVNDVEKAFEVVFEFDILHHAIKVKTLEAITKPTNIYLSLQNVLNSITINEDAEDIVTVLDCEGNDLDITTVNPMGTNYIVDFSYYKRLVDDDGVEYPWMSKELIEALDAWEIEFEKWQKDDPSRTGHTEAYGTLVEKLQELYAQQAQSDADIQYANLKLTDLQAACDQWRTKREEALNGSGYVTAETVDAGAKSMKSGTTFWNTAFTELSTINGYTTAPTPKKVGTDDKFHYEFVFSGSGMNGTPRSFITNYFDQDDVANSAVRFYFMDGDARSYCKLVVSSEVGVVKDENDSISGSGTVEVRGVKFTVEATTGGCKVTMPNGNTITLSQSNGYFVYDGVRYRAVISADGIVSIYCFYVSGFDRYTTYIESGSWITLWQNHISKDLNSVAERLTSDIGALQEKLEYITNLCNVEKFISRRGQELGLPIYNELSNYWIEGSYSSSNFATYDTTTMAERISLAGELMTAAKADLAKSCQPKFELTVDAINFIRLIEFKQFTDELELGRSITIEKADGVLYHLALMTLEYDLDKSDTFSMTFSNASRPEDTAMTFADLLKETSSVSRTVAANWSNLTDYTRNKEKISNLVMDPLDATLRIAKGNMYNQEFIVDATGILGRKWTDNSQTTFEDEQIRIMNNTILFTSDNWETASLALGRVTYVNDKGENVQAYGLIAEAIIGDLMLGRELQIRNASGTILLNEDGILIRDDYGDAVFQADRYGNLTIVGEIVATKLTLQDGVTIGYDHVSDAPDPKGFIFSVDNNKRATLNAHADSIAFSTGQLSIASTNFTLDADGKITAKGAHIEGEIEAEGGSIGGFTIGTTSLYNGCDSMSRSDGTDGVYIGVDGINIGGGNFTISKSGVLQTKKGEILLGEKSTSTDKVDDYYVRLMPGTLTTLLETTYDGNKKDSFGATLSYGSLNMHNTDALELYGGGTNYLNINTRGDGEYTPLGSFIYATTEGDHIASLTVGAKNDFFSVSNITMSASANSQAKSWMTLYADSGELRGTWQMSDGAAITSDKQYKNSIEALGDRYEQLFDALRPVRFKYNRGTSGRYHTGFIAQDVKEAVAICGLDTDEFAAYLDITHVDGEKTCCLRYDEFIALCVKEIQKLKSRVRDLESNKEKNE